LTEFGIKNWDKPKWGNPLLFGETDFTVRFADPMFPIQCATVVELRLQHMGDLYEKPHFTMDILISGGCKVWVKILCNKLPKGTPLRQIWSNISFGLCGSDVVLTLYCGEKKSTRESPLEIESRL